MICFECEKEINLEDKKMMLAIEVPYRNLWFHKDCYNTIKEREIIYLTQNAEKCYNYHEKRIKNTQK